MNAYQTRLGIAFASVALVMLLISSSGQSTIGYAQFAYAVEPIINKCPNFPSPISLLVGSGSQFLPQGNRTTPDYQYGIYIKQFSMSGLWMNASGIGFESLRLKTFSVQTWFWGENHTKSSQSNTTVNIYVTGFAAKIFQHSAVVTTKHAEGNYTIVSMTWEPVTLKLSGDNLKGTIVCGVT